MAALRTISGTPQHSEWSPFHLAYLVQRVHGDDATALLETQACEARQILSNVPAEKESFRYAPEKWSLRQVVGHLCDGERILSTRCLASARGDTASYPPFDEEAFAEIAGHDEIPLADLLEQFLSVRNSTLALLSTFRHEEWRRTANFNNHPVSSRAWAFAIFAHLDLHLETIRTRYLG